MNKLSMNKKVINIINEYQDLDYTLKENEMIVINCFFDNMQDLNIKINQSSNSCFVLNLSCIVNHNCNVNINGLITGNNNRNVLNIRCLSKENLGNFKVNVKVDDNTKGNEVIEDLKGINENGAINFLPVLEIDTNEVDAQHFATIGNFDKNELFYLQTKGLSLESAYELLKKSFMFSLFNEEFILNIKKGESNHE